MNMVAGLVRNIGPNNTNNIEEKLGTMQRDIMQKVDEKLDEKFASFLTVMQQMLQKKTNSFIKYMLNYIYNLLLIYFS